MKHVKRIGVGLGMMAVFVVPYLIPHFGWIFAAISFSVLVIGTAWLLGSTIIE